MAENKRAVVLYLEDDSDLTNDLNKFFKLVGIDLLLATNKAEADEHLESARPDAFLFDLELDDGLNGFEVAVEYISNHEYSPSDFMFLTAWDKRFDRPEIFSKSSVFRKPASPSLIAKTIHESLKGKKE